MKDTSFQPAEHYQNSDVAERYDRERFTSQAGQSGHRREVAAIEKAMSLVTDAQTALDIPCGTGRITQFLLERGLRVTGGDISEEMIAVAKAKLKSHGERVDYRTIDLRNLDFSDDAFDVVTCVRLFGHVPGDVRVEMLREMKRVTRKWILVNYFRSTAIVRAKRWLKRCILKTYEGVENPVLPNDMLSEIREAGLEVRFISNMRVYSEEVYILATKS